MTKTIRQGGTKRATAVDDFIADPSATVALPGEHGCAEACPSHQQPADACDEEIRVLAHNKWEAAGSPAGDGVGFWLEAEREVNAERSGSSSAQG